MDMTSIPEGTYFIPKWDDHFENSKSRKISNLSWVPMPISQGTGYCELMNHPNGVAHFGCWVCIVQVAARCPRGVTTVAPGGTTVADGGTTVADGGTTVARGVLLRSGPGDDPVPHTAKSLALLSRVPEDLMEEAIVRLCQIGWLRQRCHHGVTTVSPRSPEVPVEQKGIEQKGTEQKGTEGKECIASASADARASDDAPPTQKGYSPEFIEDAPPTQKDYSPEFIEWWGWYPLKKGKGAAAKAYAKARKRASPKVLLDAVRAFSEAWDGHDTEFCPAPSTWLNQDRWEDDRSQWGPKMNRDDKNMSVAEEFMHQYGDGS